MHRSPALHLLVKAFGVAFLTRRSFAKEAPKADAAGWFAFKSTIRNPHCFFGAL